MTEVAPEAPDKFVQKVKELLESITGKPYTIAEKSQLTKSIWAVYINEDRISEKDKFSLNEGAYWIQGEKDGVIRIYSVKFYHINDVASDYGTYFQDVNVLLDRNNWGKYRKKVPGLIAELEAAERIANKANKKYGTNITLWSGEKPCLETSFDAKDMGDSEKIQEIERHARAMYENWDRWREWARTVGGEIYKKTEKNWQSQVKFMDALNSRLQDITKSMLSQVRFRKPGARWALVGLVISEPPPENRGVWSIEERKDSIAIYSDNFETINARNELEYNSIKVMGGFTASGYEEQFSVLFTHKEVDEFGRRISKPITQQEAMKYGRKTIVSPQLLESITEQVSREFKVDIRVMKDKPVLVSKFETKGLRRQEKVFEIEKRAKALAEAWRRIKELAKGAEDTKA